MAQETGAQEQCGWRLALLRTVCRLVRHRLLQLVSRSVGREAMQRNMPDPLPVLLLGRLAVDKRCHNIGLGQSLLRDAMPRAVNVEGDAGFWSEAFPPTPRRMRNRSG